MESATALSLRIKPTDLDNFHCCRIRPDCPLPFVLLCLLYQSILSSLRPLHSSVSIRLNWSIWFADSFNQYVDLRCLRGLRACPWGCTAPPSPLCDGRPPFLWVPHAMVAHGPGMERHQHTSLRGNCHVPRLELTWKWGDGAGEDRGQRKDSHSG